MEIRGKVKGVPSGDTLVIMGMGKTTSGVPPEKTITLSSLMAPRLARQSRPADPFAWQSREFLRSLCLGKEVVFQVDYSARGREFGTVCVGDKHIAFLVVAQGWAKVWDVRGKEKGNGEFSPHLKKLLRLQEQAKEQGVGHWSEVPGASQYAVRKLPPSAVSNPASLDVMALLNELKGSPTMAFVENVRDGSTVRVYLLPDYLFVQVFVAGIQAPSMGKRIVEPEKASSEAKGITSNGGHGTLLASSAQKKASSPASVTRSDPDPYGRESKHFTEISVLHRYVVSATTALHDEKVEEPKKMEEPAKTEETAATVVEEEAVVAPATPEVAKEAETTLNDVVSDESAAVTNGEGATEAEAKATEEEVKVESIPKEVMTTVEEDKKTEQEEQVVVPVKTTEVAENFSDAPVEMEPEADAEVKIEAEVAKEDDVTGTNDEEEKPIKEVEDKVDEKVEAAAVSEAEEETKKTEE